MAKLSDLFGRKGGAAEVDKLLARAANGNGNGGNHISVENLSDVGSRMGDGNEVLRNLLTDTGRKISELDDLKEAFRQASCAVQQHPRALEQEKSQTMSLSGMLAEARTAYETLRGILPDRKRQRYSKVKREDCAKISSSREANRALKAPGLSTDDINARRAQIAELTVNRRWRPPSAGHSGIRRALKEQHDASEKCIVELEENSQLLARASRFWTMKTFTCKSRRSGAERNRTADAAAD
jgi:hypothetical protein